MYVDKYGNPNDYTRVDVLRLARIVDPLAWCHIPIDQEPTTYWITNERIAKSISIAGRVLLAGYRDSKIT